MPYMESKSEEPPKKSNQIQRMHYPIAELRASTLPKVWKIMMNGTYTEINFMEQA
jgi:hypothetical protein